jgi:hypothetical protein
VRLPAENGSATAEGLVERKELLPGVYLAGSLVKVVNGCVMISLLNTTEKEVEMPEPVVMVTEVDTRNQLILDAKNPAKCDNSRYERVLNKLGMKNLNSEEKTSFGEIFSTIRMCSFFRGTV